VSILISERAAVKLEKQESEKPLIVIVYSPSILRFLMKRNLRDSFRYFVFSTSEKALAFVRSLPHLDALVTELDLDFSTRGGCNIARAVKQQFPKAFIFVFADDSKEDHRLILLRGLKDIYFLSKPFDVFFLSRYIKKVLYRKNNEGGTNS